jgi:hypothetical protein
MPKSPWRQYWKNRAYGQQGEFMKIKMMMFLLLGIATGSVCFAQSGSSAENNSGVGTMGVGSRSSTGVGSLGVGSTSSTAVGSLGVGNAYPNQPGSGVDSSVGNGIGNSQLGVNGVTGTRGANGVNGMTETNGTNAGNGITGNETNSTM